LIKYKDSKNQIFSLSKVGAFILGDSKKNFAIAVSKILDLHFLHRKIMFLCLEALVFHEGLYDLNTV